MGVCNFFKANGTSRMNYSFVFRKGEEASVAYNNVHMLFPSCIYDCFCVCCVLVQLIVGHLSCFYQT